MPAPLTTEEIRAAYRALYMATANALDAQRPVINAKRVLIDFDAVSWPGGNETERKAAKVLGTSDARAALAEAEDALAAAEREQALAKLLVAELHDMLRLAEWEQQETDLGLTRVGLRELPALLRLAEAMEDKPVDVSRLPIDKTGDM